MKTLSDVIEKDCQTRQIQYARKMQWTGGMEKVRCCVRAKDVV